MKLYLTDLDLDWNSSEDGYISIDKQSEILDNLFAYEFDLDLPDNTDPDDVNEELKYEVSKLTGLDIYFVNYEVSQ